MPSIKKRARKREATKEEAEAPESSPTRPIKRRRAQGVHSNRAARLHTPESASKKASSDEGDDVVDNDEMTVNVIASLATAKEPIVAAQQWANTQFGIGVDAYAKLAGRDWTYYVKKLSVQIGRPSDALSQPLPGVETRSSPGILEDDSATIHLDLGPSKTVSRVHAILEFDPHDGKWHILVNGRNGLRINTRLILKRGQKTTVNSGDIIDIAGTQMMFVTAEGSPIIDPVILHDLQEATDEAARWNDQPHAHPEALVPQPVTDQFRPVEPAPSRTKGSQTVIAPAPPEYVRPVSPTKSPRKVPSSATKQRRSPRETLMDTDAIPYHDDMYKDSKPPHSYATLISKAILSSEEDMMPLQGIYEYIMANYSYYRNSDKGWQNSIRHNLSLNKAFQKKARESDEPGKGMKWYIQDEFRHLFVDDNPRPLRGAVRRGSSAPNSPMARGQINTVGGTRSYPIPPQAFPTGQLQNTFSATARAKTPPLSLHSPAAREAFTPDHGPRNITSHNGTNGLPILDDDQSPLAVRPKTGLYGLSDAATAHSPPTLSSSAYYDDGQNMVTPALIRQQLKLGAPSTARLPSSFMQGLNSSPAPPLWRVGPTNMSTPAAPPYSSPFKSMGLPNLPGMQSSSPPPVANGSPTKATNGRRAITELERISPRMENGNTANEDEEDEVGIDLARGYPTISAFHQMHKQASSAAS